MCLLELLLDMPRVGTLGKQITVILWCCPNMFWWYFILATLACTTLPKKAQMSTSARRQLIVDDASKRWGTPNICFLYSPPTCSTLAKGHGGPSKDKVLQLFNTSALKTTLKNIWWFCDWIDNLLCMYIWTQMYSNPPYPLHGVLVLACCLIYSLNQVGFN